MKLKIGYPPKFEKEKSYIVDTVFRHFLKIEDITLEFSDSFKPDELEITCEDSAIFKKIVFKNILFDMEDKDWLTTCALPTMPLEYSNLDELKGNFLFNDVPVLYGKASARMAYEENESVKCDVDLFGGMFFLLTLYEEFVINKYDEHGRFNHLDSIIFKSKLHLRPVVNEYLEILKALFTKAGFIEIKNKRTYQLVLSHDVDVPFSHNASAFNFIRNVMADLILRKSFVTFLKKIIARLFIGNELKYSLDPYNNLRYLMKVSEKFSIKSHFNFIAVNGKGNIDGNYEIADEYFRGMFMEIYQRGHVIGLHPSYDTFNNLNILSGQYEKLKGILDSLQIPTNWLGGRQHYLRWKNPETWQIWEDVGLKYDSTLGSEYYMGFRCGTCYEFPVFNLLTKQPLNLVEYPLLVMDVFVFKLKSMEIMDKAIMDINRICRFYNGNMTFLFHNNYAVTKNQKNTYEHLISKLI